MGNRTPEAMNTLFVRISVISILLATPFVIGNLVQGRYLLGGVSGIIIGIFAFGAWSVSRRGVHHARLISFGLTPAIIVFLTVTVATHGIIGIFWSYPAVLLFYFLLPDRRARLANIALLLAVLPMAAAQFPPELSARIIITLIMVSFFTAIFVSVINAQNVKLETINEGLRAEIAERHDVERNLAVIATRHQQTMQDLKSALCDAHDANQAKSRFLSGMTHELRTPLNAIIGFGQMLDGRAGPITDEKRSEYIGHILNSGDRLYGLINQVLDLAEIEAGKLVFTVEEVSPRAVAARVTDELTLLAQDSGVTLHNETIGASLPYVAADQARMTQALVNLVSNAIKYNRDGGTVTINADVTATSVRMSVRDTGIGISPENQTMVFESFNRLGVDRTSIEGSGVGLSLTKEFVEKMDGTIGFDSTVGEGSTFWFDLPLAVAAVRAA